ncbi:hypothetical protein [Pseudophaeobacter sp.]|uniref:hypothetical protein n=1 Tax=Pseudophaeobacter sp. TaxID=1971739 RepID=UPI00329986D3
MCKKTLHFHIGAHKTATTALQDTLAANADLLARAGLLYPKAGRYFTGHHPLALALRDPERRQHPLEALGDWPAVLQEIEASPAPHVLLSSENFEWLQDLSPLQPLSARYHLRVIYSLRSPPRYLESFYNQLVKDLKTRESRPLETYICEHGLFFLDSEKLLRRWSAAFGPGALRLQIHPEQRQPQAELMAGFLRLLEFRPPPGLRPPPRPALQKVSLPPDALEYLRLRNLHGAPQKKQHRITMALAQIAQTEAPALQRTRAGLLSLAAQRTLLSRFDAGNRRLARAYLGSDRAPFDPKDLRAHPGYDRRLGLGDDLMISRVEALLNRFEETRRAPADASAKQADQPEYPDPAIPGAIPGAPPGTAQTSPFYGPPAPLATSPPSALPAPLFPPAR